MYKENAARSRAGAAPENGNGSGEWEEGVSAKRGAAA